MKLYFSLQLLLDLTVTAIRFDQFGCDGAQSWQALCSSCANSSYVPSTSFTCSDAILHTSHVIRLICWESFDANLLKPASYQLALSFYHCNMG
jgi:hypothetical protein